MSHETTDNRPYDIILFGATSFVGQLTAEYLNNFINNMSKQDNHDAKKSENDSKNESDSKENNNEDNNKDNNQPIKWAIAGRNANKLDDIRKHIGNADIPVIIANTEAQESIDEMVAQTRVIISTVGPYLKYGEPVIKACAAHGTDYVDLTGEAIFIKNMMDKYLQDAKESGARIVNSCGFDSIPSDLGVYFTQMQNYADSGRYCDTIHMRVKGAKGGLSGGTIASMATIFTEAGKDKALRKQLANPYILNNDNNPPTVRQTANSIPKKEGENERWIAPFIMESINSRIVHRSNQCLDYLYGRDFKYDEALLMPSGIKGRVLSYGMTAGIAGFATAMSFKPSRELLNEHVLPKTGEGPSKEEQKNGYFNIRFEGLVDGVTQIETKVTGNQDPGYGSTKQMLAQAALCLLQDISKDDVAGGFWTPASAMGEKLIVRLEEDAGISFDVLSLKSQSGALK